MLSSHIIDTIESAKRNHCYISSNQVFVKVYNPHSELIASFELDDFSLDPNYEINQDSNVLIIKKDLDGDKVIDHIDMSFISAVEIVVHKKERNRFERVRF